MMKIPIFDKRSRHSLTVAGLALATVAIQQAKAQDEEFVDPSNPAIAAEVLQVPDVQDLGKRSADLPVKVLVTLRFNNAAELHQLVREQSDPASSNYHRYLTPAQFAERFGPTVDQLNQVVAELTRAGFQVTETSSNRLLVHATAPSSTVENYFKTDIHTVNQPDEGEAYMNVKPVLLPDALVSLVKAVHANNLVVAKPGIRTDAITGPITGLDGGFTPVAIAQSFDYPVQHGTDGTGHTAAVIIDSDVRDTDLSNFFAFFPITRTGSVTRKSVNGGVIGKYKSGPSGFECALDVETIAGLAPGGNVIIYIIPSLTNVSIDDAANQIVTDNTAEAVNMSFGGNEFKDVTFESALTQGNAEGITFVASSGDSGSNRGTVSTPAAEPHVLALGGTVITHSSTGYPHNQAWSGSGGGVSKIFGIPTYQKGVSGLASTTKRNVPDVALPAYFTDTYFNGGFLGLQGTSWSSPAYVALQLELNEAKSSRFGWVNNNIYSVFKLSKYADFYDVTRGSNGGFKAKAGYDNVSGIGSPKGETLATDSNF
jgi:kumamolisin